MMDDLAMMEEPREKPSMSRDKEMDDWADDDKEGGSLLDGLNF